MSFYGRVSEGVPSSTERSGEGLPAPPRRRWRKATTAEPFGSADTGWVDSPWKQARRRQRGILVALAVVLVLVVAVGVVALSVVRAASNYKAGKQALAAGRYDEAARKLGDAKILAILPYADATSLHNRAQELSSRATAAAKQRKQIENQAAALYATADTAMRGHRYGEAIRLYRQVLALDPAYADTQARLIKAEQEQKARQLLTRARASFTYGHWKLAAQRSESVLAIDPRYPGAAKLHTQAVLRVRLEPVFKRAVAAVNAARWQRARTLVKSVLRQDPTYPKAHRLLARIQAALAARAAQAAARSRASATPAPAYTPPAPVYRPPAATPPPP
jgi:tetratricopeptide (TPR) repeat protein